MSTIWTPGGERPVPPRQALEPSEPPRPPRPPNDGRDDDFGGGGDPDGPTDEELAELQRQLAETPAAVVVVNHCIGLFQLAALHLNQQPPNLVDAQLAIDALGGAVEATAGRLGEDEQTLRDALAQIRLAFVQVRAMHEGGPAPS